MQENPAKIKDVVSFWIWVAEKRMETLPKAIMRREAILKEGVVDDS